MRRRLGTVSAPDGLAISVEVTTWGPEPACPVVAMHATGFCKEVFRPVAGALATMVEAGSVTAVDHRGHGASDRPDPPYDWWDLGRDILAVVAGSGPVVGLGHSAGGAAVVMAELLAPGTFSAMVLVEPIFVPPYGWPEAASLVRAAIKRKRRFDDAEAAAENFATKPAFAGWHPAALAEYVEHGLRPGPDGLELACPPEVEAEFYRMGSADETWARLHELTLPVTLVVGEHSTTHHGSYVDELVARFGAEPVLDVVAGASHFVVMERPELIAAHVAARLDPTVPTLGLRAPR